MIIPTVNVTVKEVTGEAVTTLKQSNLTSYVERLPAIITHLEEYHEALK